MSLNTRYNRILVQVAEENLRTARARRVRIRELRAELRKRAEEIAAEDPSTGVSVQLTITKDMRQQLADLGYSKADVKTLKPQEAVDIIEGGVTKGKAEMAAKRREKVLDVYEERTLQALEKAKKRLQFLKNKRKSTEKSIPRMWERYEKGAEDDSPEAHKRATAFQQMIEDAEVSLRALDDHIQAQDKLIQRIIQSEDGLIEELQELNESAAATPTPEDDKILEQLVKEKIKDLSEIAKERKTLEKAQRERERKEELVFRSHRQKQKLFEGLGSFDLHMLNELDDELEQAKKELDAADRDVQKLVRTIMQHERHLFDKQTEERIRDVEREIEEAHRQLPEFEQILEESKKEIAEEDPDQETGKVRFYKDKANAMQSFVQRVEPRFRDFVTQFIGPDIPADPTIEKALRFANERIIKRAAVMQQLSDRYRRNDMHRSAILLAPVLYEVLARNMDAVLEEEGTKEANLREAEAIFSDLVEAGYLKEAISFREVMEKGKDVGRWTLEKGKELSEKAMEEIDKRHFQRQDVGPRREMDLPQQQAQKNLRELQELERELRLQQERATHLLQEQTDPAQMRRIRDAIRTLDEKIQSVGEQKNVIEKGLSHQPAPGMMRGVEQAARPSKSDYQQAVALMQEALPDLVQFFALIPDDEKLERELLRQSDRIAKLAHKLIQIAFKAKKKYPNLPPTIQAYGHMFIAIDDALDRALRSNEGVERAISQAPAKSEGSEGATSVAEEVDPALQALSNEIQRELERQSGQAA